MKIEIGKLIKDKNYCKRVFNFFIKNKVIRNSDSNLFEKHLNKLLDNLEFGNFIFDEHKHSIKEKLPKKEFYDWVVIIYYYAIYHSALALISKAGFESKNHLASISALIYVYYHKNNVLRKEDIEFVIENLDIKNEEIEFVVSSKKLREKASYRVAESFNLGMAKELQEKLLILLIKLKFY